MNDILEVRGNIYNCRNFQSLYSTRKTTVRFGTGTVTYRGRQIWDLIPDNIKNVLSEKLQEGNQKMDRRKVSMQDL